MNTLPLLVIRNYPASTCSPIHSTHHHRNQPKPFATGNAPAWFPSERKSGVHEGHGLELHTQAQGALCAARGLHLSTHARPGGTTPRAQPLDIGPNGEQGGFQGNLNGLKRFMELGIMDSDYDEALDALYMRLPPEPPRGHPLHQNDSVAFRTYARMGDSPQYLALLQGKNSPIGGFAA